MAVYWVNTVTDIRDHERVRRYIELAGPAMTAAGGRFVAKGAPEATLEGAPVPRMTIIEFDDTDAAARAYRSPGYRAALDALGDGATRHIQVVPGADAS